MRDFFKVTQFWLLAACKLKLNALWLALAAISVIIVGPVYGGGQGHIIHSSPWLSHCKRSLDEQWTPGIQMGWRGHLKKRIFTIITSSCRIPKASIRGWFSWKLSTFCRFPRLSLARVSSIKLSNFIVHYGLKKIPISVFAWLSIVHILNDQATKSRADSVKLCLFQQDLDLW